METLNCNYNCKWQKDGICYLRDEDAPKTENSTLCAYFCENEEDFPNFSSDSELP